MDAITEAVQAAVCETLNGLTRWQHGPDGIVGLIEGKFGDYLKVEDVAQAFGLALDKYWDQNKETYRGFKINRG